MCTQKKIAPFTKGYWGQINEAAALLRDADRVILGIGSGLSAAGGLDYTSRALAQKWFPEYVASGLGSLAEIQSVFWWQSRCKLESYWGYWARHIWRIRYASEVTRPYLELMELVRDKDYYVITTNCDGQVQKAGFPREKIVAPQGDYALFQCANKCSDEVYDNKEMVERMIANMASATDIRPEDIPKCPRCGANLVPNLRCDDNFVEKPHLWNVRAYDRYVNECADKKLVLLELGVGYNTPGIIRYPFEQMTEHFRDAHLVRVNMTRPEVPHAIAGKATCIREDLGKVLDDLRAVCGGEERGRHAAG